MDSILTSIKKLLGIEKEYTHFDSDIIIHINSVLMDLNQIGIGPENGFSISGDMETWDQVLGTSGRLEAVKTFVYLKVKMVFDPPSSSTVLDAMKRQIDEYTWRLQVQTEIK